MDRVFQVGLAALLGCCAIAGCGKSSSPDATATNASADAVVNNAADPATNSVALAASDFLDAVLKGDTQRAGARLTPLATQQITKSGKQFAPPGLDNATFRIGDVRTPSETQAIVQCVLTHTSADGQTRSEEMCCLMRRVDSEWRVSGIASGSGPGRSPMILDFENPPQESQVAPPIAAAPGQPGVATPPAGRPSPPRSAQETPPSSYR